MRSLFSHGPMEKISEAEYRKLKSVAPLKTERKTKYGNREVTYQEANQAIQEDAGARNWSAFRMIWDRLSVWLDRETPMKLMNM